MPTWNQAPDVPAGIAPHVPSQEQMAIDANRQDQLGWILDKLVQDQPHVRHAVAVSADGLLVARSAGLGRDDAERLAASVAGIINLTGGLCQSFEGQSVIHTMVTMVGGIALIIGIPGRAAGALAVVTGAEPDIGKVGFACTTLVQQLGSPLSVPPASAFSGQRVPR
ncbi:roadblock/LC7 domain-containing protein [Dactylosporangium sp. CA-233914]|uniref:roadblock/LC7 domain-containing protein n=1 Tax=Dactylosporangium sp. CA-233914 TaxID=3239934 RepID=UPI003D8B188E